jgi:TonB family protein
MNLRYRRGCNFYRTTTFLSLLAGIVLLWPAQSLLAQSSGKTARKVVVRVEPEYPAVFKYGRFQAHVVALVTVLPNGNVSHVDIKSGNPMFAEFATKALMKWKYAPAPSQTVEDVSFNFE